MSDHTGAELQCANAHIFVNGKAKCQCGASRCQPESLKCLDVNPSIARICTLERGHTGDHASLDAQRWPAAVSLPVADAQPRASDETSIHPAGCGCVSCLAGYSEPSRALPGAEDAPAPILTPEQVAAMAAVARFVASIDVRDLCTSHEYLRSRVASLDAALAESNAAREGLDNELSRVSELLVAHDGESSHSTCSAHLAAILARSAADQTRA